MPRLALPLAEFNRVLGGGIVPGSMVLIGGDPGIGKSTLLLEVAGMIAESVGKVLYVSGEESAHQIKLRADRLGLRGEGLFLLPETDLQSIIERGQEISPRLVIIDSIQTVHSSDLSSAAGSVGQVRECTQRLMRWAKSSNTPIFIVGHVTKDGSIAGPNTLEHIVDVVLYLEGERYSSYRLLRGAKNRFGSTDELGVFEMRDRGMVEVANPSLVFLSQRSEGAVGSVIVPTIEGTRPSAGGDSGADQPHRIRLAPPQRQRRGLQPPAHDNRRPHQESEAIFRDSGHYHERGRRAQGKRACGRPGHRPGHRFELQKRQG